MRLFISFEGGEATGKTTQSAILRDRLVESGYRCILVHEPGGTPLGERLRPLVKGDLPASYGAELFLFSAARAELVSKVIKPTLQQGTIVITDRYVDSTTAYQGYGRGLRLSQVQAINAASTDGLMPDLTILLDIAPEEALTRRASQLRFSPDLSGVEERVRVDPEGQSKFENVSLKFHTRVRDGYLKLASKELDRWLVVDASQPTEAVADTIWARVQSMLPPEPTQSSALGGKG